MKKYSKHWVWPAAAGELHFLSDVRKRTCLFVSLPGFKEVLPGLTAGDELAAVQNAVTQAREGGSSSENC